jgi:hypothetical protein
MNLDTSLLRGFVAGGSLAAASDCLRGRLLPLVAAFRAGIDGHRVKAERQPLSLYGKTPRAGRTNRIERRHWRNFDFVFLRPNFMVVLRLAGGVSMPVRKSDVKC